jgi:protein involved in ribonucleotide reduction
MIDVYYYTLTGNIPRFLAKCGIDAKPIGDTLSARPYILVTNTLGFGQVPDPVSSYLRKNHRNLIGVAGSGNRNWGDNFAKAATLISEHYSVPIIHTFELSGTADDIKTFTERVRLLEETYRIK